ncbi:MAG: glutathione S-transferase [Parvibaculum sp.]|jgi:glutathione S-transferase|nr:glutathione S-transferase [Parvibaculum sp.]|tara:strand:- start:2221 stop:2865 length:645 start_codon:yes stop_codon:yes gene_type:complete
MIRIWGRASAFNLQKAYWALLETGQSHERIDAGGDFGGLDSPDFLARNPNGRIPVIDDDGFVLWESQAIVRYLAEQYAPTLIPDDVQDRALAAQWMDWAQTILLPAALDLFWAGVRMPKEKQSAAFVDRALKRTIAALTLLDKELSTHDHLVGDSFTLADIPAGTCLFRFFEMKDIERPDLPHVSAWYELLKDRPAYQQAVMVPFDELVGKESF